MPGVRRSSQTASAAVLSAQQQTSDLPFRVLSSQFAACSGSVPRTLNPTIQHSASRPAFRVNVPCANVTPHPNVKCGLTPQQSRCVPPTHNERPRRGAHSATGSFSLPAFQAVRTVTRTATIGVARLAAMSITQRAPCRRLRSLPRAPCRGSRGSRRTRRTPCRCFRCRTGGRRTSCSWSSP